MEVFDGIALHAAQHRAIRMLDSGERLSRRIGEGVMLMLRLRIRREMMKCKTNEGQASAPWPWPPHCRDSCQGATSARTCEGGRGGRGRRTSGRGHRGVGGTNARMHARPIQKGQDFVPHMGEDGWAASNNGSSEGGMRRTRGNVLDPMNGSGWCGRGVISAARTIASLR